MPVLKLKTVVVKSVDQEESVMDALSKGEKVLWTWALFQVKVQWRF